MRKIIVCITWVIHTMYTQYIQNTLLRSKVWTLRVYFIILWRYFNISKIFHSYFLIFLYNYGP